jgi:hypothetical protein
VLLFRLDTTESALGKRAQERLEKDLVKAIHEQKVYEAHFFASGVLGERHRLVILFATAFRHESRKK